MAEADSKPRVGALVGIVAIASVALVAWIVFRATHPQPVKRMTAEDAVLLLKSSMGAAMFGNGKPIVVVQQNGLESRGLLAEYNDNPEKFKTYAGLFDTAMSAVQLGKQLRATPRQYQFPLDSAVLPPSSQTRDAWNHPYCVNRVGPRMAIVSGGPSVASFSCQKQRTGAAEIEASSKSIFQSSAGEVVVILSQPTN